MCSGPAPMSEVLLCIYLPCFLATGLMTADSDVTGGRGMERNISDQLNKAYEAYRNVSIEKDNVKKELQQKVEYRL